MSSLPDEGSPTRADGVDPPAVKGTGVRLHAWRHPTVIAAAGISAASGFAQFSGIAALGDVARAFGEATGGVSLAEQAGLSGTTLGIGLAIIRLASLGSLPLAGIADEVGRRRVLLACIVLGLALTATAAASPGYWWFVILFALARPALSATNAVAGVLVAEETSTAHRAKGMVLITAGYGIGAGVPALLRGVAADVIGFRGLFLGALVPLALVPLLARRLEESERFEVAHEAAERGALRRGLPVLGVLAHAHRARLALLAMLTFSFTFVAGPQNTYLFLYAENLLGLPTTVTAAAVLAAAPIGLVGLLLGRWGADRLGRRPTAAVAQVLVGLGAIVTYSGSGSAAVGGYLFGILVASMYAPGMAALSAELFPTSLRATAAGWLACAGVAGAVLGILSFGVLADRFDAFGPAAVVVAIPVALSAILLLRLPETRGLELEDSAPEQPPPL